MTQFNWRFLVRISITQACQQERLFYGADEKELGRLRDGLWYFTTSPTQSILD